jgi:hypothetical protein
MTRRAVMITRPEESDDYVLYTALPRQGGSALPPFFSPMFKFSAMLFLISRTEHPS